MRFLLGACALAVIFVLALASVEPWDFGIGVLLGCAVMVGFRGFLFAGPGISAGEFLRRARHVPRLIVAIAVDIAKGTISVTQVVLAPNLPQHDGFVAIPDGRRTESGLAISGLINTLSPGSVLIDTDPEEDTWTIHALDISNAPALIDEAQEFYERYQRPVWP